MAKIIQNNVSYGALANAGYAALCGFAIAENTFQDGAGAYVSAKALTLSQALVNRSLTTNGLNLGNVFGSAGGTTVISGGNMTGGQSCAIGDILMVAPGFTDNICMLTRCDGTRKPVGVAMQAVTAGQSVDYQIRGVGGIEYGSPGGTMAIVNNRSSSSIAAYALLKVDTVNPGGVTTATSMTDGIVVGINGANAIPATSTGYADEVWF